MTVNVEQAITSFENTPISADWAFSEAKRSDTSYITHGYHRYPAKFIPQLARRLIETYSEPNDMVLDPFCGCGTTLVESVVAKRYSYGSDINPIAIMMTKAKTQHLDPADLELAFHQIQYEVAPLFAASKVSLPENERIDYWFKKEQITDLSRLLNAIQNLSNADARLFFLCGFSNILKNCSIWNQRYNKPARDLNKKIPDVMRTFNRQIRMMMRGNAAFRSLMDGQTRPARAECRDSRWLPLEEGSVDLVVTSPPYVTSYEYGDLHQLSMLWLEGLTDLRGFREQFIGSSLKRLESEIEESQRFTHSSIASEIGRKLQRKDSKTASSAMKYFESMYEIWLELHRVVRMGGKVCIVIGNTRLKGVEIKNAEVFAEQLQGLGFRLIDVIKREIPSKNLPSTRNKATGRFAKTSSADMLAYPTEFILTLEKCP